MKNSIEQNGEVRHTVSKDLYELKVRKQYRLLRETGSPESDYTWHLAEKAVTMALLREEATQIYDEGSSDDLPSDKYR